jgi:hypothetical protein
MEEDKPRPLDYFNPQTAPGERRRLIFRWCIRVCFAAGVGCFVYASALHYWSDNPEVYWATAGGFLTALAATALRDY